MNDDVRAEFRERAGFDPIELFDDPAERRRSSAPVPRFPRELAAAHSGGMAGRDGNCAAHEPDLDIVLTHVDDRFDTGMRDAIGADAPRAAAARPPRFHVS